MDTASSSWLDATAETASVFAGFEQPPSEDYSAHQPHQPYDQHPGQDYTFVGDRLPYLEPRDGSGSAEPPATVHGLAGTLERYEDATSYASYNGYMQSTGSTRSYSAGSHSPALPALSPPSTAGSSWDSSPTSLHSPYALSPSLVTPLQSPTKLVGQHPAYLLPSVDLFDASPRDAQSHEGSSPFAHAQNAYLQQHSQSYSVPTTPTRQRTISEGIPSSLTPRGNVQNALSYRSPGPGYSPSSSPSKSPYARSHTPTALASPSRSYTSNRTSTAEHLTYESSSKRRQSHLSIDVPPYQPRSPSRNRQQPQQLDPSATSGFGIVGEVELEASQEMEQLLGQLDSFLGPDATSDSPLQAHRLPPSSTYDPQATSPLPHPPFVHADSFSGSIDISGVRLNPEDMAMLDEPEFDCDQRQYPASAPAWQTTFTIPRSPYQHPAHVSHFASSPLSPEQSSPSYSSSQLAPPFQLPRHQMASAAQGTFRPRSTPLNESFSDHAQSPPFSHRRRRSSLDGLSSLPPSQGYLQAPAYAYDNTSSQHHPYARPAPTQRHTYSPSPSASSISSASSPPALKRSSSVRSSPTKGPSSPRKTRTSPVKKKEQPMFVNFSATDSKKLLSGVAPSGSSKRRKEEADAREAARAAAVAAQA